MRYVFIGGLIVAMIVYGILSRRPELSKRIRDTCRSRIEPHRVRVARRPLLWFMVLGAVPAIALAGLGTLVDTSLYPVGAVAFAALLVAWAGDESPRRERQTLARLGVAAGVIAVYLAVGAHHFEWKWSDPLNQNRPGDVLRWGLVPALVCGWVVSGAFSPTVAVRALVRRLWASAPLGVLAFSFLAVPLAVNGVMLALRLTGVVSDPLAGMDESIERMLDPFGGRGWLGVWQVDLSRTLWWTIEEILWWSPVVVALFGFAARLLLRRLSPLLTAVALWGFGSVCGGWRTVESFHHLISDAIESGWPPVDIAVIAMTIVAETLLMALIAVWLCRRSPGSVLPALALVTVSGPLGLGLLGGALMLDPWWGDLLAESVGVSGVAVTVMIMDRMWRRPDVVDVPSADDPGPSSGDVPEEAAAST